MLYFEVSAKNNSNIQEMLFTCVSRLPYFENIPQEEKAELVKNLITENAEYEKKEIDSIGVIIRGDNNQAGVQTPTPTPKNACCTIF